MVKKTALEAARRLQIPETVRNMQAKIWKKTGKKIVKVVEKISLLQENTRTDLSLPSASIFRVTEYVLFIYSSEIL